MYVTEHCDRMIVLSGIVAGGAMIIYTAMPNGAVSVWSWPIFLAKSNSSLADVFCVQKHQIQCISGEQRPSTFEPEIPRFFILIERQLSSRV